MVVAPEEILELDQTLVILSELPRGWAAERAAGGSVWRRFPFPPDPDE